MQKKIDISRRSLLTGGVAAGTALLAATDANATVKLSQTSVKFSAQASKGHNCGSCGLFQAPSDCMFVQGPMASTNSCWIWRSKDA